MSCIYLYFLLKLKTRKNQMYIDELDLKVTDKPKRHDLWSLQHRLLCFLVQPVKRRKLHSWLEGYTRGWRVACLPPLRSCGGLPRPTDPTRPWSAGMWLVWTETGCGCDMQFKELVQK